MQRLKIMAALVLLSIILPYSSNCQKMTIVSGNFKGLKENDKVYLSSTAGTKDSAYVKNGIFEFTNLHPEKAGIYFISVRNKFSLFTFPLFLRENSQIHLEVNNEFTQYKITGDKNAVEQNGFYQGLLLLGNEHKSIDKEIAETSDSVLLSALNEKLEKSAAKINLYYSDWVSNHRSSAFSVAVIRLYIAKNPRNGIEDTLAEKYYDALLPIAKASNAESDILESGFENYNDKYSKIQLGSIAPNFAIKDTTGKEIRLSDFNKKYLLIDFWASWCGPCRENNPMLKELYNKYKERGLNVVSISMDIDAKKWKEAINKDGMDWFQGSDLSGENDGVGAVYRINAVPLYILVDPNRKIILKSLGGDINLIEEKLDEIFE